MPPPPKNNPETVTSRRTRHTRRTQAMRCQLHLKCPSEGSTEGATHEDGFAATIALHLGRTNKKKHKIGRAIEATSNGGGSEHTKLAGVNKFVVYRNQFKQKFFPLPRQNFCTRSSFNFPFPRPTIPALKGSLPICGWFALPLRVSFIFLLLPPRRTREGNENSPSSRVRPFSNGMVRLVVRRSGLAQEKKHLPGPVASGNGEKLFHFLPVILTTAYITAYYCKLRVCVKVRLLCTTEQLLSTLFFSPVGKCFLRCFLFYSPFTSPLYVFFFFLLVLSHFVAYFQLFVVPDVLYLFFFFVQFYCFFSFFSSFKPHKLINLRKGKHVVSHFSHALTKITFSLRLHFFYLSLQFINQIF
ncbi:uncharacterized protein LOC125767411 [Anopheles funestus]|uniref:uncharacterized protein LOC125767411 n=1 Tax=Anopheles funestus TaxID=62324 RepID=UPI0020C69704|nr:uncharacterized protein LOC125767411 [Anopheles funestus]